jgi:hypothetical protein
MNAVSSYLTFSPLPFEQSSEELPKGGLFSVALSIGSLESARLLVGYRTFRFTVRSLTGAMLYGVRTFLRRRIATTSAITYISTRTIFIMLTYDIEGISSG